MIEILAVNGATIPSSACVAVVLAFLAYLKFLHGAQAKADAERRAINIATMEKLATIITDNTVQGAETASVLRTVTETLGRLERRKCVAAIDEKTLRDSPLSPRSAAGGG